MLFHKTPEERQHRKEIKLRDAFLKACETGTSEKVERLLAQGAKINAATEAGTTPLLAAIKGGNTAVAGLLIERGADVNTKAPDNGGALTELYPAGTTPLLLASSFNRAAIASLLISSGADIAAKDRYGLTASHYAAKRGNVQTLVLLHARGADFTAEDKFHHTPEFYAHDNEHEEAEAFITAVLNPKPPQP